MKTDNELYEEKDMIDTFMGRNHLRPASGHKFIGYHNSWDWLMPVVEKIATIHRIDFSIKAYIGSGGIQVFDALADTQKSETISFIQEEEVGSLLSVTYKAVVEFIKWFNQQSNG